MPLGEVLAVFSRRLQSDHFDVMYSIEVGSCSICEYHFHEIETDTLMSP